MQSCKSVFLFFSSFPARYEISMNDKDMVVEFNRR